MSNAQDPRHGHSKISVPRPSSDFPTNISTFRRQPSPCQSVLYPPQLFNMYSIRRAATRATLTSTVSAAATAPKSQTISAALRTLNAAAAVSARCFSVASPRAFSRSVAFRDEYQRRDEGSRVSREEGRREYEPPSDHCLFVQNYSFEIKSEDITEAFSKYGEVVGVSMPPKRSFCFVYFRDAESVNVAAENVDGTFWHGRRIVAKPRENNTRSQREGGNADAASRGARRSPAYSGPPTSTIYVGNIAFEASDADLNQLFSTLEDVSDVRVAVDRATGWPRGFAHADFHSVESATRALEALKTQQIRGRDLKVSYAPPQKEVGRSDRLQKKQYNSRDGQQRNSQRRVEKRVEAEQSAVEEAQKETKPEAGKQDMNWNA